MAVFNETFSINLKGRLLSLSTPLVMGILNLTPDSFYDGYRWSSKEEVLKQVGRMIAEGADIIDIGGMSSRPGSEIISAEEESERILGPIIAIHGHYPELILSVDTIHAKVAHQALCAGASVINDISAGTFDPAMLSVVAESKVPFIIMHMQGLPHNMQLNPVYDSLPDEVIRFLAERIRHCRDAGIKDIIIDPGFGFGKTTEQNFQILKGLELFKWLERPLLAGLSRKSMITRPLGIKAAEALNGTTVLNTIALMYGANILRVHDVKAAREAIRLFETYRRAEI